jgi:SAM-dependent methyltransferase
MGRWSRRIAPHVLDWLGRPDGLDWMDVGCGTGALSAAIVGRCSPRSVIGIDPSDGFVATARSMVPDRRADFLVGDAQALPAAAASRDIVASALMLNFVPDKPRALAEMKRVVRPGGMIAFYVWDYPGGGIELIREFWDAAIALDAAASALAEDRRERRVRADRVHVRRGADGVSRFRGLLAPIHAGRGAGSRLLRQPCARRAPALAPGTA